MAKVSQLLQAWNTKSHIYVGLFSLLFLWLFAVSGFIMNHPLWFGSPPERSEFEKEVVLLAQADDQAVAEALLGQLGIDGEIIFMVPRKGHLVFRVNRPNRRFVVDVDLEANRALVRTAIPGAPAVLLALHTTTGVRTMWNEPKPRRDWIMTKIWSASMDAICVGLIFLVLSSLYMWLKLRQGRTWGGVALTLGTLSCAFFVWGLSLIS